MPLPACLRCCSGDDDSCGSSGAFRMTITLQGNRWYWFAIGPWSTASPPTLTTRLNLALVPLPSPPPPSPPPSPPAAAPLGSFANPYIVASLPFTGPSYSVRLSALPHAL